MTDKDKIDVQEMQMYEKEVREMLENAGFTELYRVVMEFEGWRKSSNADQTKIRVKLMKGGPNGEGALFHVEAEEMPVNVGNLRSTRSNPCPSMRTALSTIGFQRFD